MCECVHMHLNMSREWIRIYLRIDPRYTNMFVGYFEAQIFSRLTGPNSTLCGCYINSRISETSPSCEQLKSFLSFFLSFHPALEFSCSISNTSIVFFDSSFSTQYTALTISIPYKLTDTHSKLNSCNSTHTKSSIHLLWM